MYYAGKTLPQHPIAFEEFNPDFMWQWVDEMILPKLTSARHKLVTQNFIDHARAEAQGNLEALLATCSQKREDYRQWGDGTDGLMEGIQPQSYEELVEFYGNLMQLTLFAIHLEPEKFLVADEVITLEGNVHQLYPGKLLPMLYDVEVDDPDAVYMLTVRMALFFVFDEDGKGCGEQAYPNGSPPTADHFVKMPKEFVPQRFWDNLKKYPDVF